MSKVYLQEIPQQPLVCPGVAAVNCHACACVFTHHEQCLQIVRAGEILLQTTRSQPECATECGKRCVKLVEISIKTVSVADSVVSQQLMHMCIRVEFVLLMMRMEGRPHSNMYTSK